MAKDYFTVNSIDFDSIKDSLKDHLRQTDTFKDYNFEGSALSLIIDILAYNTQYQAFYNNMSINEMYLDTAVAEESITSISKMLGYTPSSVTAAMAEVDITLDDGAGLAVGSYLPAYTEFVAAQGGLRHTFFTTTPVQITSSVAPHLTGIKIYEGTRMFSQFLFDNLKENNKFIVPEKNIDISTIKVRVQKGPTDDEGYSDSWKKSTSLMSVGPSDKIYFLQKNRKGNYEIYFGDNVLGVKPEHGSVVYISYMITKGVLANGVGSGDKTGNRVFSGPAGTVSDVAVTSVAQGGSPSETMHSVRMNAPLTYQAQNRAVTTTDYKSLVMQEFSSLESVSVYGGEDEDPPQYGRVMIAIKPFSGTIITDATKKSIENMLKKSKGVVGVIPVVVDPDYTYVRINSSVRYSSLNTGSSSEALRILITSLITEFLDKNLEKFDVDLFRSKLQSLIDDTSDSILGNDTKIVMEKRISPNFAAATGYSTNFSNQIHNPHAGHVSVIESDPFTFFDSTGLKKKGKLKDDSMGVLQIIDAEKGNILVSNAGTVDYETGVLTISRIILSSIDGNKSYLAVRATPRNADIFAPRNTIITYDVLDPSSVSVSMVDTDNVGNILSSTGNDYT